MKGKTYDEVVAELEASGKSAQEIKRLAPFRVFSGNRPTNSILLKKVTPRTLGSLIAMFLQCKLLPQSRFAVCVSDVCLRTGRVIPGVSDTGKIESNK